MNKIEALEKLNKFVEHQTLENELSELLVKFEQMAENDFSECSTNGDVYHKINSWSKPKAKRKPSTTSKIQTYYKLNTPIQEATDKAYGIVTGTNNKIGSDYRTFITWIPKSQCKEIEKNIYVPAWLGLWDSVDKESKVTI